MSSHLPHLNCKWPSLSLQPQQETAESRDAALPQQSAHGLALSPKVCRRSPQTKTPVEHLEGAMGGEGKIHSEPLCRASQASPARSCHSSQLLTLPLHHISDKHKKGKQPLVHAQNTLTCAEPWVLCHRPHLSCAFCSPIRCLCSQVPAVDSPVPQTEIQRSRAPKWRTLILLPPDLSSEASLSSAP